MKVNENCLNPCSNGILKYLANSGIKADFDES